MDVGSLVVRLVLFEKYTMRTIRLMEVPDLVRAFGEGGLRDLLSDGCLQILCESNTLGQVARLEAGLPKGAMRIGTLVASNRPKYIRDCLQQVHSAEGISYKQARVLKKAISSSLVQIERPGVAALGQLEQDLKTGSAELREGIGMAAAAAGHSGIDTNNLRLEIDLLDNELLFTAKSNLSEILGISTEESISIVERGLLAVGNLNMRIELMHRLGGISGSEPGEIALFEGKLASIVQASNPDAYEAEFLRVREIAGLPAPDLSTSPSVDVAALLAARETDEAKLLRSWLRGSTQMSDEEISESFHKVQEALSRAVHGRTGKVLRFAATTAAGFLPGGQLLGVGLGTLDNFLVEEVIQAPGPYSFLSNTWPSLFTSA